MFQIQLYLSLFLNDALNLNLQTNSKVGVSFFCFSLRYSISCVKDFDFWALSVIKSEIFWANGTFKNLHQPFNKKGKFNKMLTIVFWFHFQHAAFSHFLLPLHQKMDCSETKPYSSKVLRRKVKRKVGIFRGVIQEDNIIK